MVGGGGCLYWCLHWCRLLSAECFGSSVFGCVLVLLPGCRSGVLGICGWKGKEELFGVC